MTTETSIDDIKLTVRAYNALKNLDVKTVSDALALKPEKLLKQKNFGEASLYELENLLGPFGWPVRPRQSRQFPIPNPPSAKEISAARDVVTEITGETGTPQDHRWPWSMDWWEGEGWHKAEIYFGILIGMQIASARQDRAEAKKERKA
jgi:hypothetical protein